MLNKSDINKKISFKVSYRLSSTKSKPGRNIIICVLNVSNKTINAIRLINIVNSLFKNKSIDVKFINVGGGLAIDYKDPIDNRISNFQTFIDIFNKNIFLNDRQLLHFELGRSIVGQCGFLISKILFTKKSYNKNFVIVDAGMNDLVRPALYDSYHKIINISSKESDMINYDVVGPICESSDTFVNNYSLPRSKRGDFIVICSAGAYGESMSSNYNLRNKLKSYYSDTI